MSESCNRSRFRIPANRALVFVCSRCGTGRCFDFVPVAVRMTVRGNLGNVRSIVTARAMVRFTSRSCASRFNVHRPLGFVIVSKLVDRIFFSRKLFAAYRAVNDAFVASVYRTGRLNAVFNHCFCMIRCFTERARLNHFVADRAHAPLSFGNHTVRVGNLRPISELMIAYVLHGGTAAHHCFLGSLNMSAIRTLKIIGIRAFIAKEDV